MQYYPDQQFTLSGAHILIPLPAKHKSPHQ